MTSAPPWTPPSESHWQASAPDLPAADPLPSDADVAVVGGGLLGACTAYWLSRAGARVALVEQAAPAFGATGRNGGFMVAGLAEGYDGAIRRLGSETARAVARLTLRSRALLREVLAEEGIDCAYREPGRLGLAVGAEQHAAMARGVAAMQADGFSVELLERAQVQELIGTPLGPEIAGGLYSPEDGLLHPARLIQGLLAASRRRGARLCAATVAGVAAEGGGVRVETSAGALRAGAAVIAVNAWTGRVVPALREVVVPVRGQVLAYAPLPPIFRAGVGAAITPTGEYWHQTPDGTIVLGGCRAAAPGAEVGETTHATTDVVQSAIEQVFPQLFPALGGLRVARRWAGLMAFTRDYLPVADQVPGVPGGWVVGGFCGHGMPFGLPLGQLLAEAAAGGRAPADLAPFRLDRPTLRAE